MRSRSLLLIAVAIGTACGRPDDGVTEIVYWTGWSGHEFEVQQQLVNEFNQAHPKIRVRLVSQFGNSGYQKVRIAFAGDATPDLMSTVWADELASYAQRGVLTPLDDYLKASGRDFDREFVPSMRKGLRVDGKVYALAVATNTEFLVYNKDILDSVKATPPQTPEELRAVSKAILKKRKDGTIARYGYKAIGLRTWAYVFGGGWIDANGNVTANRKENIEALTWMKSFNQFMDPKRAQAFQATFGNEATSSGPFFVGKIGFWQTGEWSQEFLRRYGPNVRYSYQAFPAPVNGKPDTCFVGPSAFVIPKACRHKAETWTFLNWLSSPYAVEKFCSSIGNVPALMEAGNAPAFTKDPLMKFAVDLSRSPNAVGPPGVAIWPTYSREISRAEDSVLLGDRDPKAALDDLQRRMAEENQRTKEDLGR